VGGARSVINFAVSAGPSCSIRAIRVAFR
jgi:hypothetical protein